MVVGTELVRSFLMPRSRSRHAPLMQTHGRSFFLAAQLLPVDVQRAFMCVYAFCRRMDDLADNSPDPLSQEAARASLTSWRDWLVRGAHGPSPDAELGGELSEVLHRYEVPTRFLTELISGLLDDLEAAVRITTFEDQRRYCYLVASTVGLSLAHVLGARGPRALHAASELGIAMQLTNILRDVGEDLERGRLYLPMDELNQFGLDSEKLADLLRAGRGPDERLRSFMRFQVTRNYGHYERGLCGIQMLPPRVRPAILLAAYLYRAILGVIERNNYDVLRTRAVTTHLDKAREVARVAASMRPRWGASIGFEGSRAQ